MGAKTKDGEAYRDWVASFMVLAQVSLAVVHAAFRQIRAGGLCSLHCIPPFRETKSSQKLSVKRSPQLMPVTLQGGVGRFCPPARALVRAATATKHEPGSSPFFLVVVRLTTGGLGPPRENVALPACTQRRICCGAALASHQDPLCFSGDKRGRCKALFFAVLNGASLTDPEPVNLCLVRFPPNAPRRVLERTPGWLFRHTRIPLSPLWA